MTIYECKECHGLFPEESMQMQRHKFGRVYTYFCKNCHAKRQRLYREKNRELIRSRAVDANRRTRASGYAKNWKIRERLLEPEKPIARQEVRKAIRHGLLSKSPCEICGDANAVPHHNDYSKPLEVRWLCPQCHQRVHSGILV